MPTWRVLTVVDPQVPGAVRPVDQQLPSQAAARALAATEKGRLGVQRASVHFCPHARGEPASEGYSCRDDPRAQYQEL
jgi:hypothetical protein